MNEQEKAAIATLSAESGLASQELQATLERLAGVVQTAKEDGDNMTYALKGEDNPYQKAILFAMNRLRMPIYSGTVDADEIARRRKANKAARISRRKNRK